MAWKRVLKPIVAAKEIIRPGWASLVSRDRRTWRVTLECGHQVKRNTYGGVPLPKRCQCRQCAIRVDDYTGRPLASDEQPTPTYEEYFIDPDSPAPPRLGDEDGLPF